VLVCGALLSPAGCRGYNPDTGWSESCDPRSLAAGQVRARRMPCDDEGLSGGEGRRGDYVIENACARFVVQHPAVALTLLTVGGGTVIDAAAPSGTDILAELVPLVEGGWLQDIELELLDEPDAAGIRLTGVPVPIPFLGGKAPDQEPRVVTYRLASDGCALQVEGNDGFWLMPGPDTVRAGATLRHETRMLGVDGQPEDFGGGVRYAGGRRFAAGSPGTVMAAVWPGGPTVSGHTEGEGVEVLAGGTPVGWLGVDEEGSYRGTLPAGADGLRAMAEGFAPGPIVAPGTGGDLPLGGEGWLGVRVEDRDGLPLPALLSATSLHGRRGLFAVEPEGSWLPLGAGAWDVELTAGPLRERVRRRIFLQGTDRRMELSMDGAGPPPGWLLADLDLPAWPARDERLGPAQALALAGARGVGFAVLTAPDEVATAAYAQPWDRWLAAASGSRAATDLCGAIVSWPWKANSRKPAHGAVPWYGLSAEDALRVAAGESGPDRTLMVEMDWVRTAGPVTRWAPRPDLVRLANLGDLDALIGLYEGWADLSVAGPLTWVDLGHEPPWDAVQVERALIEGRTVATTGPWLLLEVDGQGPGSQVRGRGPHQVRLQVRASPDQPLTGAGLVADGRLACTWDLADGWGEERLAAAHPVLATHYLLAFAWGPPDRTDPARGDAWAVTGPVWAGRP